MKLLTFAIASALSLAACGSSSSTTTGTTGTTHGAATSGGTNAATTGGTNASTTGTNATTTTGGTNAATTGAASSTSATTTSGTNATTGSSTSGASCSFDPNTGTDSCVDGGYECSAEFTNSASGTCVLPEVNGICLAAVGCQSGGPTPLVCAAGFEDPTTGAMVSECVEPCTSSAGCAAPSNACVQVGASGICTSNLCDVDGGVTSAPSFSGPFFNACNAAGTGDGQCLPFGTGSELFAECYQTGSAAAGAACSLDRGGSNPPCVAGQICMPSYSDAGPNGNGLCMQITDGGANCTPSTYIGFQIVGNADWSICAQPCSQSSPRPSGYGCATTGGGMDVCIPL